MNDGGEKSKPPDYYKCIKVPIKSVLKNPDINLPKITDAVYKCNKIVINTLLYMKLYLLDYYEKTNKLPVVNKVFINNCMKILCVESTKGRPPKEETQKLKDELTKFYDTDYKPLIKDEHLTYLRLNVVLDYLSVDILTMYENNIKQHYVEYVERYVNVVWQKKLIVEKIRKIYTTKKAREERINHLCNDLRKIKNDIIDIDKDTYKSKPFYHQWIKDTKKKILPDKQDFKKNNLNYDLQCNSQDYLVCMLYMMKEVEKEGMTVNNVFPLRTEIIPKHIPLDTTTIVLLMMTKKQANNKHQDYLLNGNLKKYEDDIWRFFFRTELHCFRKLEYSFHHMIDTDGVSCSILFLRNDLIGKRVPMKKTKNTEKYIDELKDYTDIKNKKIVAIDPGKSDLIYCVDGDNKEANTFRYSQDSRRKETKAAKYAKIILDLKQEKIDGKTITEHETELSKLNHKTLVIKDFKKYIQKKCEMNTKLFTFYEKYIFRKLKLNSFLNRKKSEQRMIAKFQKIFGKPEDVVIGIGDWEQKKQMKYKEPTIGIGIRKIFKQNKYKVYLVDEFRTSCKCSKCKGGACEKFIMRKNPKPNKDNLTMVHGALSCKNCNVVWNRDCNGATNIFKIAYASIHEKERPKYLCRGKSETSVVLDDTSQPKFSQS